MEFRIKRIIQPIAEQADIMNRVIIVQFEIGKRKFNTRIVNDIRVTMCFDAPGSAIGKTMADKNVLFDRSINPKTDKVLKYCWNES